MGAGMIFKKCENCLGVGYMKESVEIPKRKYVKKSTQNDEAGLML